MRMKNSLQNNRVGARERVGIFTFFCSVGLFRDITDNWATKTVEKYKNNTPTCFAQKNY